MSTSSQNPDPATFDEMVEDIPELSVWEVSFDAAEEDLKETSLDGYEVEDIGCLAWGRLHEDDRKHALNAMFYTYWAETRTDRDELDLLEREREARATLRDRLAEFEALTSVSSPVSRDLVADIAALARQLVGGAA